MKLSEKEARKVCLRKQAEYRRQGKSSEWLARFSKAFWRTHYQREENRT